MSIEKKPGMTREEATKLYETLKKRMEGKHGKAGLQKLINEEKKSKGKLGKAPLNKLKAYNQKPAQSRAQAMPQMPGGQIRSKMINGQRAAILLVVLCAGFKLTLSLMEFTGIAEVQSANASINNLNLEAYQARPKFTSDEVKLLKSLDARRVELERRKEKFEREENRLKKMDREYAARLTEIRTITQKLQEDREKSSRKKNAQLEQLASVYGTMNPKNSAELIEQLDISIAKKLIERMPEKRMAQILALMSPDRALTITRMLSGN